MTTLTISPSATRPKALGRAALIWRFRELAWMLAWRDIRVRYRHTLLGAAWAVVPPLAMMAVFSFVFGSVTEIDRQRLTGHPHLPYPLFAFSGLVPWMLLANGLTAATTSLIANRQLVTKIYFPREVFPISAILSCVVDFMIAMALVVALAAWYHFQGEAWRLELNAFMLFVPIVFAVQLVFMLGMGMLLSMATLFYRDVNFIFRAAVQLWMFASAVIYNLDATTGWKRLIIHLNPMTPILRAYRDCLLLGRSPFDAPFLAASAVSVAILLLGWRWFRAREDDFAEFI